MKKIMLILLSLFAVTYLQAMERGEESEDESERIEPFKSDIQNELDDFIIVSSETFEEWLPPQIMEIIFLFIPNDVEQVDSNQGIKKWAKKALNLKSKSEKLGIFNLFLVSKQFNKLMRRSKVLAPFLKQVVEKSPQKAIKACIAAASKGNIEIINLFIQVGLTIDACNENGLFKIAIIKPNCDLVKFLITHGANVNNCCNTGSSYFSSMINVFKDDKSGYFTDKMTPLMFACANGADDIVKILLQNGANINAQDDHGNTALMFAASRGMHETVDILMSQGAKAYIFNDNKNNAILLAYISHRRQAIQCLVRHNPKLIDSLLTYCYSERKRGPKKYKWQAI